ncbi:hypothetical protein OQA88_5808 [Cercophora sp. LCS_1]
MNTQPYDGFTWRQVVHGVWQRDVDEAEEAYSSLIRHYSGSGRMHFAITGHITLTVPTDDTESPAETAAYFDESVRAAWLRLRYENPTIASCVYVDPYLGRWQKRYETVPDEATQEAWLERTFQTVCNGQTGAEWANSDPPAPKEATLFVVKPPSGISFGEEGVVRRDLVLRSPHDVIDGIGTLQLFDNLISLVLRAVAQGPEYNPPTLDSSETSRLSPPFRVAANVPPALTPNQQRRLVEMQQAKEPTASDGVLDIGIPYHQGPLVPGKHQRVARTISPERASQLLNAVKSFGATVTHAFHAAIAMAIRNVHAEVSDPTSDAVVVRYTNYILRNERPRCSFPFHTPRHAAAVYHSVSGGKLAVEMTASPSPNQLEEFTRILIRMRDYYHSVRDDADHHALAPAIWTSITPQVPLPTGDSEGPLPIPPPNPKPSVSLSSMGVVDRIISPERGGISAYNPWVTGEELGTGLGLFLGSFRGELCLSAAFNEAWHTREEVDDFLGRCERIVFAWVDGLAQYGGYLGRYGPGSSVVYRSAAPIYLRR